MTHPELLRIVSTWPEALRSEFDERAAIIQDGCNVSREESERRAYEILHDRAPMRQGELL